jgi:hypothetical protein
MANEEPDRHPKDRPPPVAAELAALTQAGRVATRLAAQYQPLIARIRAQQQQNAATTLSLIETQDRVSALSGRAAAALRAVPALDESVPIQLAPPPVELRLLGDLIELQERSVEGQQQLLEQQAALLEIQRQSAEAGNRALWWVKAAVIAAVVVPLVLRFV